MKRIGFLFETVCSFKNLLEAANRAMRGKTGNIRVAQFSLNMETELLQIQEELTSGTWQPKPYHCFDIYEPKQRYICAADFRDRVVHHAVCNVLEPIFERTFIYDSYACRKDRGSHRAIKRVQSFCRKNAYFLKADVRKYFESVNHEILKQLIRRKIKDDRLLKLLDVIIDHPYPGQVPGKGLPIGNLTSQWWANFYIDGLDHYVKDELGVRCYVRYMDDMVAFSDDKISLHELKSQTGKFLQERLKLEYKESATYIAPVSQGISFLGFRIFPGLIRLKRENRTRFQRNYREKEREYLSGTIDEAAFIRSVHSMIGHTAHADTVRMRRKFFADRLEG